MYRVLTRIVVPVALAATVIVGVAAAATTVLLAGAPPAHAVMAGALAAPPSLSEVIDNIRNWLVGLLVTLATLFLTIGGLRYLIAGGDPGEVAKAKDTLKYAAFGYLVAALAPVLASILKQLVAA